MNNTFNACLLATVLLISSIPAAFSQQNLSAKEQLQNYNADVDSTFKEVQWCVDVLNKSQSKQIINDGVFGFHDDNPNKLKFLSSDDKLTDTQRNALVEYAGFQKKCRTPILKGFVKYPSIVSTLQTFTNEQDIVYADLIAKKITIGQANKALMKIDTTFNRNFVDAMNAVSVSLNERAKRESEVQSQETKKTQLQADKTESTIKPRSIKEADDYVLSLQKANKQAEQAKIAQEAKEAQRNLDIVQKAEKTEQARLAQEAKDAQKNLAIIQKAEKAKQAAELSKKPQQPTQAQIEEERLYQIEQARIRERQLAIQAEQVFNQTVNLCTQAAQQYQPPRSVPMPQGQMVGNQYIAPSWSQNLGAMLGNSPGGYTTNTALFESCMKARGY
jgi:hypothetical protein